MKTAVNRLSFKRVEDIGQELCGQEGGMSVIGELKMNFLKHLINAMETSICFNPRVSVISGCADEAIVGVHLSFI